MDIVKLTATKILKTKEPEKLFSKGDIKEIEHEFRTLAKKWHSDVNKDPKAHEVFIRIQELRDLAVTRVNDGIWCVPGLLSIKGKDGKEYQIKFHKKHPIEIGEMLISDMFVTYIINSDYKDLFDNAEKMINSFEYANDRMKTEVSKYLPTIKKTFESIDGRFVMVIEKTKDLLLLRDVHDFVNKKMNHKHIAWIQSSLHNLACYFSYAKIGNNDISLDTYFISAKHHGGALLGGWWYSKRGGSKLTGVPLRTYNLIPPDVKIRGTASRRIDLELIRAVGRELLGDVSGSRLPMIKTAPKPMVDWVRAASSGDAIREYSQWKDILKESFGERKFIKWELDSEELYEEGE